MPPDDDLSLKGFHDYNIHVNESVDPRIRELLRKMAADIGPQTHGVFALIQPNGTLQYIFFGSNSPGGNLEILGEVLAAIGQYQRQSHHGG